MDAEAILLAYPDLPDQVINLNRSLITENASLKAKLAELESRIVDLEAQLAKNSSNSSKPPSSDGLKKPPSPPRQQGKRKSGGQPKHPGSTLKFSETPDSIITHPAPEVCSCGNTLSQVDVSQIEKRQVFDLPLPIPLVVTEHRVEKKVCPTCGKMAQESFPQGIDAPTQYGESVSAFGIYLQDHHHVPYERTTEILSDLTGQEISEGTLYNHRQTCFEQLEPFESAVKEAIINEPVAHFDESGVRVKGKLHWLHVACTLLFTWFGIHTKRGKKAMDDFDILPRYRGKAGHDGLKSYWQYEETTHFLCNAHHLRELNCVATTHKQPWAEEMIQLLLDIKNWREELKKEKADALDQSKINHYEEEYTRILELGFAANPTPAPAPDSETKKRGRKKQSYPKNLLDRLSNGRKEVLLYLHDFSVPFDNNQAERDIRPVKVRQKISGSFRSVFGGTLYSRIRSYISTVKKHKLNPLQAIRDALQGKPFLPRTISPQAE